MEFFIFLVKAMVAIICISLSVSIAILVIGGAFKSLNSNTPLKIYRGGKDNEER